MESMGNLWKIYGKYRTSMENIEIDGKSFENIGHLWNT